jgi:hypothetical protein
MSNLRSLKQAYEQVRRNNQITSGLHFTPHPGLETVARESIGPWHIEITYRNLGITMRRDQFHATIHQDGLAQRESLTGFSTKAAALAAARARVTALGTTPQVHPLKIPFHGPSGELPVG